MNTGLEMEDELGGQISQSLAISLDVKLAFNRLTSLIYSLKGNIGEEEANYQLLRISNDIAKVLKVRKNREVLQEEIEIKKKDEIEFVEFFPFGEQDTANTTLKTTGTFNLSSQNKDSAGRYHQQNMGISSFSSSKNEHLCTTSSAFRPVIKKTLDSENCLGLEIVDDKNKLDIDGSTGKRKSQEHDKEKNLKNIQREAKSSRKWLKKYVNINNNQANNSKTKASNRRRPQRSAKQKTKKTNGTTISNRKICQDSKNVDKLNHGKNGDKSSNYGLDKEEEEGGPFSEMMEEESSFILPMPCLTIDDILDSVKKNVKNGRYTPPTSVFDNVYGYKSSDNSSINTPFDDIGVKNNHVVKRMCKLNKKPKAKKKVISISSI